MPTGYTAKIKDGITFDEYAWGCARAFGALVMMRDDPNDAPIPEKMDPSDYHEKALHKASERLTKLEKFDLITADIATQQDWVEAEERREKALIEHADLRKSYTDMLAKVENWESPTTDHDKYKEFMRDQIISSLDWDCDDSFYINETKRLTAEEWLDRETEKEIESIDYHTKEMKKEYDRTDGRNSWIDALRNSLK